MFVQYILVLLLILLKYQSRSTRLSVSNASQLDYPRMFQSNFSGICLIVVTHLALISSSAMATIVFESTRSIAQKSNVTYLSAEPNQEVEDPIFEDVVFNKIDRLKQFLDRGGSPDRYFHAAVNAGSIDCAKLMLDRGANINLPGDEGVTPLMTAAQVTYRGGIEMTELLIKKGANINARASRGSTALMYASWGVAAHYQDEYVEVVRLLIKHGAKVNVKNKMGDTPLSIARRGKWQKIVIVLNKAGAKS